MNVDGVIRAWRAGAFANRDFVCQLLYVVGDEADVGHRTLPDDVAGVVSEETTDFPTTDAEWSGFTVFESFGAAWPRKQVETLRRGLAGVR